MVFKNDKDFKIEGNLDVFVKHKKKNLKEKYLNGMKY